MNPENSNQSIPITIIKKLQKPKNNDLDRLSIDPFIKVKIQNFEKKNENTQILVKRNKFKKSINNIINLSSFINCSAKSNIIDINLLNCINTINNYCDEYNDIASKTCNMVYHYQKENNRDYTFNKYNKDSQNKYEKIVKKLMLPQNNKNDLKENKKNSKLKKNKLGVINEKEEKIMKKKKNFQNLYKIKNQFNNLSKIKDSRTPSKKKKQVSNLITPKREKSFDENLKKKIKKEKHVQEDSINTSRNFIHYSKITSKGDDLSLNTIRNYNLSEMSE